MIEFKCFVFNTYHTLYQMKYMLFMRFKKCSFVKIWIYTKLNLWSHIIVQEVSGLPKPTLFCIEKYTWLRCQSLPWLQILGYLYKHTTSHTAPSTHSTCQPKHKFLQHNKLR